MLSAMSKPVTLRHPDPFPRAVIEAAQAHAVAEYPRESVGFVTADGYVPLRNIHPEPETAFRVDPKDTAKQLQRGAILALVHSHPNGPNHPSYADQVSQIESGVTFGIVPVIGTNVGDDIVPVPSEIVWWGDELPTPPLERRAFIWGVFHCYQLYRDWMWLERGVRIPNSACDVLLIADGRNIFVDECERAGLRNLGKVDMGCLQVGDMLVGHVKGDFPNHCGVYLGGDDFLHHPPGTPSGKANLLRWWPHIDTVLRYDGSSVDPSLRRTG